jgi:hypothetical protein
LTPDANEFDQPDSSPPARGYDRWIDREEREALAVRPVTTVCSGGDGSFRGGSEVNKVRNNGPEMKKAELAALDGEPLSDMASPELEYRSGLRGSAKL